MARIGSRPSGPLFAMPEVGIGFFPDVGATYALPRVPHRIGVAMALTGLRANGADMAALGLATAYVESARLPALTQALERPGDTAAIIARVRQRRRRPRRCWTHAALIERRFRATPTLASIEARCGPTDRISRSRCST